MAKIIPITISEIEHLVHKLAQETIGWDEKIPVFNTRFPNVLESCVITPFQKFGKKLLYQGLTQKVAVLFYLLIKNHPFQNGNKRIAVTALFVFLYKNGKWIKVDKTVLYNTALWVASSPSEAREQVVNFMQEFVDDNMIDF